MKSKLLTLTSTVAIATPNFKVRYDDESDDEESDEDYEDIHGLSSDLLDKHAMMVLYPGEGTHNFVFDAREWCLKISFSSQLTMKDKSTSITKSSTKPARSITTLLSTEAESIEIAKASLEKLVRAARDSLKQQNVYTKKFIVLCTMDRGMFTAGTYVRCRPLETIFLPETIKSKLRSEIQKLIDSKSDYQRFCIPYRRSFLLCGDPGLGKTSVIHALASTFNSRIYRVTVDDHLNDSNIFQALKGIGRIRKERINFLVIEDVDALFNTDRERDVAKSRHGLSFSGFLNALDGLGAPSGICVFLTTNHIDKLDPALLRPGRVDSIFTFQPPDEEQMLRMMEVLVPASTKEGRETVINRIRTSQACKKVSTATLQKFFFDNREDGDDIVKKMSLLEELCAMFQELNRRNRGLDMFS